MNEPTDPGTERRPSPPEVVSAAQLLRWYWLTTELVEIARRVGAGTGGSKAELTDAVAAALEGRSAPPGPVRRRSTSARQLEGELTLDTVVPAGQRCSQTLRAFFVRQVGPGFTFDAPMRSFIADRPGATLGDAVEHWHATRTTDRRDIDGQFELNRFTRQWYLDHPGGTRAELQTAWRAYRATPVDRRDRA